MIYSYFSFERHEDGSPKIDIKPPPSPVARGGLTAFRRNCHLNGISNEETIFALWEATQVEGE